MRKLSAKQDMAIGITITLLLFGLLEGVVRIHDLIKGENKYDEKAHYESSVYRDKKLGKRVFDEYAKREGEPYPYLMHRNTPNQHYNSFNINSLGFRGREISIKKGSNKYRIFVLGGSVVWGHGATSDATTIPGILESKLNSACKSTKFEVINAGIHGYVTPQQFILLYDRIIGLDPDLIITFDGWNDAYTALANGQPGVPNRYRYFKQALMSVVRRERENFLSLVAGDMKEGVKEIAIKSMFVKKLYDWLKTIRQKAKFAQTLTINDINTEEVARIYLKYSELTYRLSKAYGIQTIFTLQPTLAFGKESLSNEERDILLSHEDRIPGITEYYIRAYSQIIKALENLKAKGAMVYNLTEVFSDRKETIYIDNAHFSDTGNEIVAEKMIQIIRDEIFSKDPTICN